MKVFEAFSLDTVNHCLWRGEARMALTPKAFDVLRYLVEHADRLVTPDEILEALWPETYVNPEGIRKYILEIRKVLGDQRDQPSFIETLPKRGYRFIANVTEERTAPLPGAVAGAAAGKMVGRRAALAELNHHLEKALSGERQLVFITGEAGIGKTTLVDAFQQLGDGHRNLRTARGQSIEGFGGEEAYYPMLEALGSLVLNAPGTSWVQTLEKHAPTWLAQFPSLVRAEQKDSLQREILGSTRGRMVREICEALEAMTALTPLILVLEDLHWADASTLDLISAFARRREPAKLLLIGTYRPVDAVLSQSSLKALKQDLLVRHLCHEVAIERLEESDVAEYLAKEFANSSFTAGLASLIHHHSGGNALFMAAIVRDIVKKGLIARERGRWTLTAPLEDIYPGIPETLQQMLEIQFAQLSEEEQRILQSGSVAGERFSVWAIAAMLESSPASLEDACDKLASRQQFIRPVGIHAAPNGVPSAHYEFLHALYRQALHRSLSGLNRSQLHLSLGERLRPICDAGKPELASELALHFEEGRDYEQATRYLMLAAENAARRFSHRDSIQILRRAFELASSVAGPARSELEIQILQRTGDAHYALGAMSDSVEAYDAAAAQAAQVGLRTAQIEALAHLAVPVWYLDPARGNAVCERAIVVSREHGDPLLLARAELAAACLRLLYDAWRKEDADTCASARQTIRQLGASSIPEDVLYAYVQTAQGDYEEGLTQVEAAMAAATSPADYLLALGAKTLFLIGLGRFGELLQIVRTGRALAEKNGEDPWVFVFREAWLRWICFDFEGVRLLSEIVMRSDSEQHAAETRTMAIVAAGYVELFRGRYQEALQYFARVRDPKETPKFHFHWRWRMRTELLSIEARLQAGDLPNARIEADALLVSVLSTAEPNLQAVAWEVRARVALGGADLPRALECVESALVILERFDVPLAAWRVHATAWDVYRYAEQHEKAEGHRVCAQAVIMRLADSFEPEEALRKSLLTAAPVRRIFEQGASA